MTAKGSDGSLELVGDLKNKVDEIVDKAIAGDDATAHTVNRIGLRAYTDTLTSGLPVSSGEKLHNYIICRVKRIMGVK